MSNNCGEVFWSVYNRQRQLIKKQKKNIFIDLKTDNDLVFAQIKVCAYVCEELE